MTCGKVKGRVLRKLGTALLCGGLVCVIALACIEAFVRPTLVRMLDYKCRMSAERVISDAVFERFSDSEAADDIVHLTFGNDGSVTALNIDRAKVNTLNALLTDAVNDGIDRLSAETVGISLGSLTGIGLLYGSGAELCFRLEPHGAAQTQLVSSFQSSGINQTMHSMILRVSAELSPVMPGFYQTVDVSCDILLAQTVIVGKVPDSYSQIVLDEQHLSDIADIHI